MFELIRDDERFTYEVEPGVRLTYRRLAGDERQRIIAKHTKRGVIDWPSVDLAVARECITGWEGYSLNGEAVQFSSDLVARLPEAHRGPVVGLILDGEEPKVGRPLSTRSTT